MKAILSKAVGGPESLVLEDVAEPAAAPGQVIVDVKAASVNFPDVLIIEDKYQFKPPRPFSPGGEISGTISALCEGVTGLAIGDRVLGNTAWGGMAERIAIDAARVVKIPDEMPFDDAAAFLMTYGTSWHALQNRAQIKAGETLLVLGAAGGVGLAAVEIGRAIGANVIAAASSQEKIDLCLARGATSGVVYPKGPFDREGQKALAAAFKEACGPNGADIIYDAIGDVYAEPALRSIAWEGRYLVVGFAAGDIPQIPLNLALLKSCDILGVFWGAWAGRNPDKQRQNVDELFRFYAEGKLRPHISARYRLDEAPQAIAHLASRKAMGKVVITL